MKEAAYQEYMKNTRIAQAVAQAEREAAAAAAHAAESAERAAKQKGHTHVPPRRRARLAAPQMPRRQSPLCSA